MGDGEQCIRHGGTARRCANKALRWSPYCHKCCWAFAQKLQSAGQRERAVRQIEADCAAAGADPASVAASIEKDLRHKCVACRKKCNLAVGGRFCSNACAVRWAVSLAQTKQWLAESEEWTAVNPEAKK